MSLSNSSENIAKSTGSKADHHVIPMNFSESIAEKQPAVYKELLNGLSFRTVKLSSVLPLDKPLNRFCKRVFDMAVSLLVFILVLPWLLPIIALLIKLDSKGPVFFFQKRSGRKGKLFSCVKFRSMIVNPEADLDPAVENDKRITRVGKYLRIHYLDELPQFFNVIMGEMSIIGPRPHMISDDMRYKNEVDFYTYRQKVKPGITGIAQLLGFTGPVDEIKKIKDRVHLDIFYIRHWSPGMDIKIIFHTIGKFIRP